MTFLLLFCGSIFVLNRSKPWQMGTIPVLILTTYFLLTESFVDDLASVHFANPLWKLAAYMVIALFPILLLFLWTQRPGRVLLGIALSFLLFLPFTRPTIWFQKFFSAWESGLWPERYAENLSRMVPPHKHLPSSSKEPEVQLDENAVVSAESFLKATVAERIRILESATARRNPALINEAIDLLERGNAELEFACVRYLRSLSAKWIGNDRSRWSHWASSSINRVHVAQVSSAKWNPLLQRGFSAVAVQNCAYTARDHHTDFLTFYLQFFPKPVTDNDLILLNQALGDIQTGSPAVQRAYRSGMLYFFLALTGTVLQIQGSAVNSALIHENWNSSYQSFRQASEIGEAMAFEVSKIIQQADSNHDGTLNEAEISSIVSSRQ